MKTLLACLSLAAALALSGCRTPQQLPPAPAGKVRTGQVRYSGPERSFVGEFSMRIAPRDFQLEISKGPGVTLMSVREVAGVAARFEGGGRSWQGSPERAPKQLRGWLALDDVFAGRPGDGSWKTERAGAQTRVDFPATGERFVFHFTPPAS